VPPEPRILIVTSDAPVGRWLQLNIETVRDGCLIECTTRDAFEQRLARTATGDCELLICTLDMQADAIDGAITWLEGLANHPDLPPVLVVAEGGDELAVIRCLRANAADYLPRRLLTGTTLATALDHCLTQKKPEPTAQRAQHFDKFVANSTLDVPLDLIPRYLLLDKLGESARASVYLASSDALQRHVALKVSRITDGSEEPQFSREYETIGALRHPSVVDIYDYGVNEGREFIAMEYFPCGDFKARLQNLLTEAEALEYLRRVAAALAVVHQQGILHRDLKPPNIMLREDGQIVLIDFGLAKSLTNFTCSTAAGVLRGSPYYMSPEQAQGEVLDNRSDLYSLGVIFYEMLTGNKPFLGATAIEVLQQHVTAPIPQLPPDLQQHQLLLEGLMAKQRDDRFASADDVLASLASRAA
jgi:eukaryotic-like serine/threonine-protein kinase